jgi:DNA-binding transcriptional MerR regulator
MRVNVYSQELTEEVDVIRQKSNTGVTYSAVRMILHSSPKLHHPPESDDDRSAVTFWLPKSKARRKALAEVFETMALHVMQAPPEDGLD